MMRRPSFWVAVDAVRARVPAPVALAVVLCLVKLVAVHAYSVRAFAPPALQGTEQAGQDITALGAGTTVDRALARRQEHLYRLTVEKDELVTVIVEQRGVDVTVQARRPDGSVIADFQSEIRRHGREQVDVVAVVGGTYVLVVKPGPGTAPGSYAIREIGRRAATDADRSMQHVRALRTTATGLESVARLDEARALFERALTIAEGLRAPDHVLGVLLFELAGNALEARNDVRAESLYRRASALLERTWGTGHPYPAMARSRLALLLQHEGQGPKAEALLRGATAAIERTLGTDHPWFAACLSTEATLRADAGDLDTAERIGRRALAVLERIEDTRGATYAGMLNNLGEVYLQKADYTRAQEFFVRALGVSERIQGKESYHVSIGYQNLGIVARERKDYAKAVDYYARALAIRERIGGADHPDVAPLLNNLANVQRSTGHAVAALRTYFHALRIWEKARGPYDAGTLNVVGNIARTYAYAGDVVNAIAFQRRADAIIETQLTLNLAAGSERQKLAFVNSVSKRTDRTVSLHLRDAPDNPDAGALAALVLLQRKGRVLDAMADTFAALRQRVAKPGDQRLLDQLHNATAQLARVALSAPELAEPDRQDSIRKLEAQKERLETELSARSAELRAQIQPVTLEAVQAALPDDAALLEFLVFRPFNPRAERNAEAYGPPHYAAYVVRKHGAPRGHDLGTTEAIDGAIDALRQALRDPGRTDLKQRARAVDEQVMRPLRASLRDATRLLISPDGDLNLVPFEALVDDRGSYLIERFEMSYLTSGRDLLRMQVLRAPRSTAVIVADPLFGEPARSSAKSPTYFAPLGATGEEARAIKALFPRATLLTRRRATEAALQRLQAPRMLHIASHGFFLQDATQESSNSPAPPRVTGTRAMSGSIRVDNPLLRSGLALAGANLTHEPHDDGILTALEASGLNLWGTRLVTLSACDTGLGEVRIGEGVYGLRRAFVLAGTETLVMSLWSVSDAVARDTMVAFYTGLRAGLGRSQALRQAKLAMLKRQGRQHPFYWASFIQSGEWASLDGRR